MGSWKVLCRAERAVGCAMYVLQILKNGEIDDSAMPSIHGACAL